jgi:hypothetical protein
VPIPDPALVLAILRHANLVPHEHETLRGPWVDGIATVTASCHALIARHSPHDPLPWLVAADEARRLVRERGCLCAALAAVI